jgi:PAS domain S-box-containing protein
VNIHVIDGAEGAFTIRHLSGPAEDGHRSGDVVPLEGTQTQQVIETGQPAITHDYAVESRFLYDRALLQSGLRSRICLPLSGRGNIIGSLTLHSRRVGAYGPREQAILERLAHQIGPAIENARLYEQVRLQAQLIDNVSESVVAKDLEGRVTYWNKGAQALYGYSAQEVLGFPITFIVKPEEAEEEQQRMQQALADGSWRGQYLQQRKDGAAIWTYTSISLVQDSQGNPSGFIRIDRDITQQRENVEALRRSEAQQRAILEAIPDAMFRLSRDGTYLDYTAPQGFDFILPPEEFLGRTINEVMPPELGRQIMSDLRHTFQTGQAQTFEYQLIQDGRQRDYEARLVVIREDEVLAMEREVTERKLLEAQLFQSQKMESLGRLVGGVAHDFNNILGGIMGYASLLKTRLAPDTDSYEFAQIIETATRRGAQLTQQLLTASRKSAPQLVPMDVNEAVAEVAQILSRTLPRNVTVIEQLQPLLPHIEGDLTQIHQVLMNLCINAADAMPQGAT